MPKVSGIFDSFDNLDTIPTEDISQWLKVQPDQKYLENYIANRIIYPQVAPVSEGDIDIDLALLREALKRTPVFYKQSLPSKDGRPKDKKIFIPDTFTKRFPNLAKLAWAFIDAYSPKEITTLVLVSDSKDEVIGSLINPKIEKSGFFEIKVEENKFKVKTGSLMVIPCNLSHCHLDFRSKNAKILGKGEITFEVPGGKLGIVIDGRGI